MGAVNLDGRNGLKGGDLICYEANGKSICAVVFDNGYAQAGQSMLGQKPAEATAPVHYALGASSATGSGSSLGSTSIKSHPIKLSEVRRQEINFLLTQARATGNYRFVNQRIQEIGQQLNCASLNLAPLPADQYQSQIRQDAFSFQRPQRNYVNAAPESESPPDFLGLGGLSSNSADSSQSAGIAGLQNVNSSAAKEVATQANGKIAQIEQNLKTLETNKQSIQTQIEQLNQKSNSLVGSEHEAERAVIQTEIQNLQKDLSKKTSEVEALKKAKMEVTAEAKSSALQLEDLSKRLETQISKIDALKGKRETRLAMLENTEFELSIATSDAEKKAAKLKISNLKKEVEGLDSELVREEAQSKKLTDDIDSKKIHSLAAIENKSTKI
ncbi:MAG TPA: hypothetical protein VM901_10245 [Bdellovibrionota bacterium]|nr:hypothetical protein [Bdellovibrionota bacterium]